MLPTQKQFNEWDSEYFDGEGQNFDVMMIKAFQAGADWQLEQCVEEVNQMLYMFELGGQIDKVERVGLVDVFKKAMRPQQQLEES